MNKLLTFRCDENFINRVKKLCKLKNVTFARLVKDFLEKEMKKNKI